MIDAHRSGTDVAAAGDAAARRSFERERTTAADTAGATRGADGQGATVGETDVAGARRCRQRANAVAGGGVECVVGAAAVEKQVGGGDVAAAAHCRTIAASECDCLTGSTECGVDGDAASADQSGGIVERGGATHRDVARSGVANGDARKAIDKIAGEITCR